MAIRRRPILILVFCFDISIYLFRMASKFINTAVTLPVLVRGMMPQIGNMIFLHTFLFLLNRRSRQLGRAAARQVSGTCDCFRTSCIFCGLHVVWNAVVANPCWASPRTYYACHATQNTT